MSFYDRYWSVAGGGSLEHWKFISRHLDRHAPRQPGSVVLDYGCGSGEGISRLLRINPKARCIAVDVASSALELTRGRAPNIELFAVTDGGALPVPSSSVDFVISVEVIEHIYDTETAFREIARVLRPGGQLFLTTPYHGLIKNLLLVLLVFDRHFSPTGPHVRFFSRGSLGRCLEQAGLRAREFGHLGRFWPISMSMYVLAEKGS